MTHQGVAVIVYASDASHATSKAESILKRLTDGSLSYDDFTLHNFDDLPATPVLANTPEGKKVINTFWKYQAREFRSNLGHVRRGLKRFDAEAFLRNERTEPRKNARHSVDNDPDMIRHYMYRAGEYRGPSIQLYDDDGEGIRDKKHLHNVLNKWESLYSNPESSLNGRPNPAEGLGVWVVTADTHY